MNIIKNANILAIFLFVLTGCVNSTKTEIVLDNYKFNQDEQQRVLYGRVQALEYRSVDESYNWLSSLYEMNGTINIVDEYQKNGNTCKKFIETIQKENQLAKTIEGVSCKVDGIWGDI